GLIRFFSALVLFVFYTIYISAAVVRIGLVLNTLFGIDYIISVIFGVVIVVPYVFIGGFLTLAWIDLFQGIFLMFVILIVPLYLLPSVGGIDGIWTAIHTKGLTSSLFPNFKPITICEMFFVLIGWGLGYFGQPHIITKFMGINRVSEIRKAQAVGMSWMTIALGSATLVGLVGIPFFLTKGLADSSEVFIQMVKQSFPPFLVGLMLCAVFAATINAMSSMVLVLSSSLAEDLYKRVFNKKASSKELLLVSRFGVILVSVIAFAIAVGKISTIYGLVFYAWSGLGASFGPLLLMCLYGRNINKYGAICGIIVGGVVAAAWPLLDNVLPLAIPPLPPAFVASFLSMWVVSYATRRRAASLAT
ncbi:MAG: hypothetical protein K940chlam2_01624, partial [Chlamydiae bacterium]|nr:hypothetical protein [Chlamydiota bacterium]